MATFSDYRHLLVEHLNQTFDHNQHQFGPHHFWAPDVFSRLKTFATAGKLMRGSMVFLALESFGQPQAQDRANALKVAAAVELFQSAVLIHDDIIDQDLLRRGEPSFHHQYRLLAEEKDFNQPQHTGESLALCVGDIGLFLAFDQLAYLKLPVEQLQAIQRFFVQEVMHTGFAEMNDVRLSLTKEDVSDAEIEQLYLYKTGHYSIILPLVLGALLSQAQPRVIRQLEQFGEVLGLLFQIKDDEIGLFGSQQATGKSVTSDAREGKKTLYYYWLLKLANDQEKKEFGQYWGNPQCNETQLTRIHQLMISTGAKAKVDERLRQLEEQAVTLFEKLPLKPQMRPLWQELISLNSQRKK